MVTVFSPLQSPLVAHIFSHSGVTAPNQHVNSASVPRRAISASMTMARARPGRRFFAKTSLNWRRGSASSRIPTGMIPRSLCSTLTHCSSLKNLRPRVPALHRAFRSRHHTRHIHSVRRSLTHPTSCSQQPPRAEASPTPPLPTPSIPWDQVTVRPLFSHRRSEAEGGPPTVGFTHSLRPRRSRRAGTNRVSANLVRVSTLEAVHDVASSPFHSLDIFLPHRHQVGLELHIERLRTSLLLPPEEQRHPVLMNAIYLWACYLSRPQSLGQHEPLYLARSLDFLNEALQNSNKVIDIIQGCCLLSLYLLTNGRLLEGSYHASIAASLAMQWGLHRQVSEEPDTGVCLDSSFKLPPPADAIERGERILAFWQVFILDRCWSVVLQRPSTIQDGRDMLTSITLPWPQDMQDYEAVRMHRARH